MDIRNFFGGAGTKKTNPVSAKTPRNDLKKSMTPTKKKSSTESKGSTTKKTQKSKNIPAPDKKSKQNESKKQELLIIDSDSDFEGKHDRGDQNSSKKCDRIKKDVQDCKYKDKNGNKVETLPEVLPDKKSHKKKTKSVEIEASSSPESKADAKKDRKRKKSEQVEIFSSPEFKKSNKKKKAVTVIESSDEEIIQTKTKKKKSGSSKKGIIFDSSDSEDEDPLPKKKKVRSKRREHHFSSDEECKQTSIAEAFQHAKAHSKPKAILASQVAPPPKKQISAADFFGSSAVQKVETKTPIGKRKATSSPVKTSDLADTTELHDDENFEKTLQQLDEAEAPKTKKPKLLNEEPKHNSLSSKLAQKVKDCYQVEDTPEKNISTAKTSRSRAKPIPTTPAKAINTVKVSPTKTDPGKKSPEKLPSPDKQEVKKSNTSFRSYLNREGPRSLGTKEVPKGADNCLEGLTFVITGVLESFERDETKTMVERFGGKVTGSLSKKTSYIVAGRDAGESKMNKANSLGTKILDEDALLDLIRKLPGKKSKYEIAAEKESKSTPGRKKSPQSCSSLTPQRSKMSNISAASPLTKSVPSTPKMMGTPTTSRTPASNGASPQTPSIGVSDSEHTLLWVDKYKPMNLKQIIGQQGDKSNARKLLNWLKMWHKNVASGRKPAFNRFGDDGGGYRAALLSGPPGVGKTTTAHLVCEEAGFDFVELNASDTRSKKSLQHEVSESLNNHSLTGYFGDSSSSMAADGKSHCLVMDEVDGMAGNEDRGGVAELVGLIKNTKIPIICMCNDRNHQKIRTLANYCFDLRFQRPRVEQIKAAMMSLTYKEGIKIPPPALNEIILASNQDIRQVIHNLCMWSATDKNLTFDQLKTDAAKAKKDLKMGPFDVVRKVFTSGEETANMSINDKSDLFFHDYSFGPLFVQENYITVQPAEARGDTKKHLHLLSRAADSIAAGDLVDRMIRSQNQWSMLPLQAIFASVIPGEAMRGYLGGQIQFPSWLGKNSSQGKTDRILQELKSHMRLQISGDKKALNMEYIPHLRHTLTQPLARDGSDGVPEVIRRLDEYDLIKEDFDSILEISQWPNSKDVMHNVESKTKAAFTRAYNKEVHKTPYATGIVAKKGRGRGGSGAVEDMELEGEEGEVSQAVESDEEDEDIAIDTMIKKKKAAAGSKAKGRGAEDGKTTSKGKAPTKGKGQGKAPTKGKGQGKGRGRGKGK